ncbi:CdvA-like protein [Candidatus Bathyarchaeota archaeon]|nr:CdvA-like protein [Candidatus Bathyarchaeota archaeon]
MEKRKQTLDTMLNLGKITKATYEYLNKDIKVHKKTLPEKITPKIKNLKKQLTTLEPYTSNLEVSYPKRKMNKESYESKDIALASIPLKDASPPLSPTVVNATRATKLTRIPTNEIVVSIPLKKRKKRVLKTKKRKKTPRKSNSKIPPKTTSRGNCRNPWNGKCSNMNTEVIIYYKNLMLPICRDCWTEIVGKNITW